MSIVTSIDLAFLSARYGDLQDGEDIELRAIHRGDHKVFRQWYDDIDSLAWDAQNMVEDYDIFLGVNPRVGHTSGKNGVSRITCLHADVDAKVFPSKADALATLERLVLRPSIIVDSGGGYQAYWHLADPLQATPENIALAEGLMKRLYAFINSSLDGVQDVSRIFRLPGTINHKPGRDGAVVEVIDRASFRAYSVADFENALPPLPVKTRTVRQPAAQSDVSVEQVEELLRYIDPLLPYEDFVRVLMAIHSVFPGEEGFALADAWSTEAREAFGCNGTLAKQTEKWDQFRRDGAGDSITIATLYALAKEGGWEPQSAFKLVERKRPTLIVPKWEQPLAAIPALTQADRPALLQRVVQYLAPVTAAWREDWADMLALAGLSAMLGHLDFGGIRPNLWLLGVGGQSAGKSVAGDVMVGLVQEAMRQARWGFGALTESTPQGLQAELAEQGGATMLYYSEYSGMLQALKHEYMSGTKQMLCDLYDGRTFRRRLKAEVVEAKNPYLTFIGFTTLSQFAAHAATEDFVSGYHSRFLFLAPDYLNIAIERKPSNLEAKELASILVEHLTPVRAVSEVKWRTPWHQKPPAYAALEDELGVNTGEVIRLEDTLGRDDVPPGRVLVRVKKVAALMAALRAVPAIADGALLVSDEDVQLARRVVLRGSAYARRLAAALGDSEDEVLAQKVMRHMAEHRSLTQREIQRLTKANKRELGPVLEVLVDEGMLTGPRDLGRSKVYEVVEG